MRAIDADHVIKKLDKLQPFAGNKAANAVINLAKEAVRNAPTLSPDEVRGEAKVNYEHGDYSCSACGNSARRLSFARKNYCDECGKKLLWEVTNNA